MSIPPSFLLTFLLYILPPLFDFSIYASVFENKKK